ncbi:HipA N-terminal domain-containing protein [Novosphingobium indicum]|uniref:HipA N-terminal domain-containing protein n=1 Tax=Novosphingobium indicum TaxID=462949 RepID=UPI00227A0FE6|nr:HipA N-terminal domain-containing protein [Novosphingobium indicum]
MARELRATGAFGLNAVRPAASSPDRFPLSLAMPLQSEAYDGKLVLPWLMNLLPEGEPLRAMTSPLLQAVQARTKPLVMVANLPVAP